MLVDGVFRPTEPKRSRCSAIHSDQNRLNSNLAQIDVALLLEISPYHQGKFNFDFRISDALGWRLLLMGHCQSSVTSLQLLTFSYESLMSMSNGDR